MIVEHIKRCYLIPVATGIALLFLLRVSLFLDGGGSAIRQSLDRAVFFVLVVVLLCIGTADILINRRIGTFGTSTDIGYFFSVFVFFVMPMLLGLWLVLPYMAIAGAASAFVSGRTVTAIVSGIAVLTLGAPFLVWALGNLNSSLSSAEFWIMLLSFLTGCGTLTVAFITHTNRALSKLRILYLIPLILLVPFQFFMFSHLTVSDSELGFIFTTDLALFLTRAGILIGGSFLAVAFIAHSNMELYKKALYFIPFILIAPSLLLLLARWSLPGGDLFTTESTLWQLLQFWIAGGCVTMGINGVIYTNDSNIITI